MHHLFSISGRAGRLEYFIHSFADVFALIVAFALVVMISGEDAMSSASESEPSIAGLLFFLVVLAIGIVAEVCVTIRRLHDLGMSGSYFLGTMIPVYNFYLGYILLFERGEQGENPYGPPLWR